MVDLVRERFAASDKFKVLSPTTTARVVCLSDGCFVDWFSNKRWGFIHSFVGFA